MIKNSALGDRLNAFRNGELEETPTTKEEEQKIIKSISEAKKPKLELLYETFSLILVFVQIAAFGYASATVFSQDWNIFQISAVGYTLYLILNEVTKIFNKSDKE